MSAGTAGQLHGKLLANCAQRPTGKSRNVQRIVHSPYVRILRIGKKSRQSGLRPAGICIGETLFLQASRSGPCMKFCMPSIRQPTRDQLLFHPDPPAGYARFGGVTSAGAV